MEKHNLCKFTVLLRKQNMLKFSRFVKKKSEDGSITISCKVRKGKPTGKQYRQICNALNECIINVLEPKPES